jgi:uncharacterized protein YggL (DUF469 family)
MQTPRHSPHRSARLRKKMRIAEFQSFGFEVSFALAKVPSIELYHQIFYDFLDEAITANDLFCGGGGIDRQNYSFFVEKGRLSATEADRIAVERWLALRLDISTHEVGPLIDSWYL